MPQSRGYRDVTVIYICRSKIPSHIYMLSISTGKNQSTKIHSVLYIPTYEYNYKVIIGCDIILQEYYITNRRKGENTKGYISMNSTKDAHEVQKENSRDEQGAWKDRASERSADDPPFTAHIWSATGRIHKLQALGSRHADLGESKTPQWVVWWMPSGVQRQTHVYR